MKIVIIIACIIYAGMTSSAQRSGRETGNDTMIKLELLNEYQRLKPAGRVWCDTGLQSAALRHELQKLLTERSFEGLTVEDAGPPDPAAGEIMPATQLLADKWERNYAKIALYLGWIYLRGQGTEENLSYDGVSRIYRLHDQIRVAAGLAAVQTHDQLREWLSTLLPKTTEYRLMQDSLTACIREKRTPWTTRLSRAVNDYRWIHHFGFERLIVINIPAAELRYYVDDTLQLSMKVIVGQPSKRTPRFAAWCSGLVLYPYWNIPGKIARQ